MIDAAEIAAGISVAEEAVQGIEEVIHVFDSSKPITATNNPLAGKSQEEIALHFDNTKNALVNQVAGSINSTLSSAAGAINQVSQMATGLHSIIDAMTSEMAVFHEFEHAVRTGVTDLGSVWTKIEQKLDTLRSGFKDKAAESTQAGVTETTTEGEGT